MKTINLAVIVALLIVTGTVFADDDRGKYDDRYGPMMGYGGMGMMGGGYGMGHYGGMGMMGGPMQMLDLSDAQRKKINDIQDSSHKKNWELMGKMMDDRAKLRDLYDADRLDVKGISAVYDRIFSTQKKMIENSLNARNQQYETLNDKQRKEWKELRSGRGWGNWHGRGGPMMRR